MRVIILAPIPGTASNKLIARFKAVPVHLLDLSSEGTCHGSHSKSSRI
jgi:hypothetical protein